jgi:hypothetical protein
MLPRLTAGAFHFASIFHFLATPSMSFTTLFVCVWMQFYAVYGLAALTSMLVARENAALPSPAPARALFRNAAFVRGGELFLRAEALDALGPGQRATYLAMVGPDGWCLHFDTGGRRCTIYDDRPDFCRVGSLIDLFGQQGEDGNALAINCCKQQIRSEYGGRGKVMRRFLRAIRRPR